MPKFDYVALTSQGKDVRGTTEAADLAAARESLRRKALLPVQLDLEGKKGLLSKGLTLGALNPLRYLPVSSRDKQFMFRQLALMVKSGHRLRGSLEMLESIASKRALQMSIRRMIDRVDHGDSFAEALRSESKVFPKYVAALVAAGERSGTLEVILDEIARSMERARELRGTLLRALMMPTITLFVAFGVLAFVVLWLVPKLTDFLMRSGGSVHWTMQSLVSVNEFFLDHGRTIAICVAIFTVAMMAAYTTKKGKLYLDRAWLHFPLFGRTSILFEMARFGGIGTLLVHSGLRQVDTLRVLGEVTQNQALRDRYENAADLLLEGHKMSDALDSPVFDRLARNMVGIGESSGSLDEVLDHIGTYFTNEVETRIQVLFATLVPAITLVVGGVVAIIYISVILTILGAVNSIR